MEPAPSSLSRRALLQVAAGSAALPSAPNPPADVCRIVFDLDPDPKNQPVLDWLLRGGFCWGIEVPWNTPKQRLEWLRERGWQVVLHMGAHPATLARHHAYKKWPPADVPAILRTHIDGAGGDPSRVIWQALLEDDSAGVGHPQEVLRAKPKTHAAAAALLQRHLDETLAAARPYGPVKRWSVCGYASTAHHFARQSEIDLVTVERANDDVDDLQTGIAFCRGAGGQYGKLWGVDFSLWWGAIHGVVNDLPTSFHKRHLFASWYAGAEHFRMEGGNLFWDTKNSRTTAIADCMDGFARFIKRHPRGRVETPAAVLLPRDNGWITPPYWRTTNECWNYARIPYRQGQRAIDGFFAAAFPGSNFAMQPFPFGKFRTEDPPATPFALSTIGTEFAPSPEDVHNAEPPLPFGRYESRRHAGRGLRERKIDPSLYRPMGQSRWGDIFDVLTDDASADSLGRYQVLILLDQIPCNDAMLQRLGTAAQAGATVVWAAGVAGPRHASEIGASISGEFRVDHAWRGADGVLQREPVQFVGVEKVTGRVLFSSAGGAPLVIENRFGEGRFITCLLPWFEGAGQPLAGVALAAFDSVLRSVQPVQVSGPPIQWLSTRGEDRYQVLLSNNSDRTWLGAVTARSLDGSFTTCSELVRGAPLKMVQAGGGFQVEVEIPPFDVGVVAWSKRHLPL